MGQLFFMGWEGTEVTPQIRTLIEDHHLGAILLTTKNLKSMKCLLRSLKCISSLGIADFWRLVLCESSEVTFSGSYIAVSF